MKQKLDVRLIEFGLEKQVFIPQTILDMLYLPMVYGVDVCPTGVWLVNGFKEIPQPTREQLVRLSLKYDKEETTLLLNRRMACVLYTMLNKTCNERKYFSTFIQDAGLVNEPHAPIYEAKFEYGSPIDAVREIFLWHKWGLKMSNNERKVWQRIWENLLQQENDSHEPENQKSWISLKKATFRKTLNANKRKVNADMQQITQLENLISDFLAKIDVDVNDRIAILKATDKHQKLQELYEEQTNQMNALNTVLDESILLEIKLAACDIPSLLATISQSENR